MASRPGPLYCVTDKELYDALMEGLGIAAPTLESDKQTASAPASGPLRILLAEDSVPNQKLAIGLLSSIAAVGLSGVRITAADLRRE